MPDRRWRLSVFCVMTNWSLPSRWSSTRARCDALGLTSPGATRQAGVAPRPHPVWTTKVGDAGVGADAGAREGDEVFAAHDPASDGLDVLWEEVLFLSHWYGASLSRKYLHKLDVFFSVATVLVELPTPHVRGAIFSRSGNARLRVWLTRTPWLLILLGGR